MMKEDLIKTIEDLESSLLALKGSLQSFMKEIKCTCSEKDNVNNYLEDKAQEKSQSVLNNTQNILPHTTLDELRRLLADIAKENRNAVKSLLLCHNAQKLSEVKEEEYDTLKLQAQCLLADKDMILSEVNNLISCGFENEVRLAITSFTKEGDENLSNVPKDSYPLLMEALIALRGSENE